jgi:hypothetical protein
VVVSAITALGMLISLWSNSLKTSMFIALGLFVLIFMPFALPGHAQSGPMGLLLQLVSPLMATYDFLARILVNNRALTDPARPTGDLRVWHHMISPCAFALLMLTALVVASPGLRIDGRRRETPRRQARRAPGALALLVVWGLGSGLGAGGTAAADPESTVSDRAPELAMSIDRSFAQVGQGDSIVYTTTVTHRGARPSRPLTVAMNIINLDSQGDIVDPEDWSPQRTQYIDAMEPGESVTQRWRVNAIMDGDYMLYMVAIPKPERPEDTSQPAASPGMHLTISPRVKLNPRGILLYVIGAPVLIGLAMLYLNHRRRRATEPADSGS